MRPVKEQLPQAEAEYYWNVLKQDFSATIDNHLKTRMDWKEAAEYAALVLMEATLSQSSLETLLMILYKISGCLSRLMRDDIDLHCSHYYHLGRLISCLTGDKLTHKNSILWPLLEQMKSVQLVFIPSLSKLSGTEMTAATRRQSHFICGLAFVSASSSGARAAAATSCKNLKRLFLELFPESWQGQAQGLARVSQAGKLRTSLFLLNLVQKVAMLVGEDEDTRAELIVQLGQIVISKQTGEMGFVEFYRKVRQSYPQWIFAPVRV